MSNASKETLHQIQAHFGSAISTRTTTRSTSADAARSDQDKPPAFPSFNLPEPLLAVVDSFLSNFASNFAGAAESTSNSSTALQEREKERTSWRDGLLDTWQTIEPQPGTEGEPEAIARVSAFLVLLDKLGAECKDDDDSAVVPRDDIGKVWWDALLKRTLLGTPKDDPSGAGDDGRGERRGRRREARAAGTKPKEPPIPPPQSSSSSTQRPLTVSRDALAAAMRMVVWGMSPTLRQAEQDPNFVAPLCNIVRAEFEKRGMSRMRGGDEWYGLRNLAECVIQWADGSMQAYFERATPYIRPDNPARIPFLSLLLNVLARNYGKAYHVLQTPLLPSLIDFCLKTASPASMTLGIKCLAIFVVSLPVIIGEHLFGIMAVYARAISWEFPESEGIDGEDPISEEAFDGPCPDPIDLFTVLYGIYPCNFVAFLKDANGYLRSKDWKNTSGFSVASGMVRERSNPLVRMHALHPALLTSDLATELTDTNRWRRLETCDVMAECHRNLIQTGFMEDDVVVNGADGDQDQDQGTDNGTGDAESYLGRSRMRLRAGRNPFVDEGPSLFRLGLEARTARANSAHDAADSAPVSPRSAPLRHASISASRSRSPQPHMPATTHFTNFQALQASSPTHSPGRSLSRLRQPDFDSMAYQGNIASAESSAPTSRAHSRASSILNSPTSPLGTTAPLFPAPSGQFNLDSGPGGLSRSNSRATATTTGTGAASGATVSIYAGAGHGGGGSSIGGGGGAAAIAGQVHKLETEIVLLQGEVAFQTYLKQLHIAHMGTLHREKVLESGAEAERQTLYRTIRTLRAQLKQTKSTLDQLRAESTATKSNWTAHIDDLKDRLRGLRDGKLRWDSERRELMHEVEQSKERERKAMRELEEQGAAFFDLQNQVQVDKEKLERIAEYEARIEALTKTLAICDEDLVNFSVQKREMDVLAKEWKRSDLMRETCEAELRKAREALREAERELESVRTRVERDAGAKAAVASTDGETADLDNDWTKLRTELSRLREVNAELSEKVVDLEGMRA